MGRVVTVSQALDDLPFGRFHFIHVSRQIFAWMVFAYCWESTPYTFPGLKEEYSLSSEGFGIFASAFSAGNLVGTFASAVLLDSYGRRRVMVLSCAAAALSSVFMAYVAANFTQLVLYRAVQGAAYAVAIAGFSTWYCEFLPTRNRGPLFCAFSFGWPVGRAIVISTAGHVYYANWRAFISISGCLLALLSFFSYYSCTESPRQAAVTEGPREALEVLRSMYRSNGTPFDIQAVDNPGGKAQRTTFLMRLQIILLHHRTIFLFAVGIFSMLSMTTVIIDTWGPFVFQHFLYPGQNFLPIRLLAMFNLGDFTGNIVSIFIADKIGRRGSFYWGFFGQAALWASLPCIRMMGLTNPMPLLCAAGMLASSTRCFAWEAVQIWTLEVFPTEVRATAFAVATGVMRGLAVFALAISGAVVGSLQPGNCLLIFSALLFLGGIMSTFLPVETAGTAMNDS